MPPAAIARLIASNICIEPTEMPCTLARRAKISPGLSSVAGQAADHTDLAADTDCAERTGQRRGTADLDNMVNATAAGESSAAFSHSGVVL
jgi:hypothetical protein